MDNLTFEDLKTFLPKDTGWHISIYIPTIRAGRETEQNSIRFKNLLREAENRLIDKGLRTPVVRDLLEPAQKLLEKPGFWQHQSDGLVVFFTQDKFEYFRLPLQFEELVTVSQCFHIKPLFPLFSNDAHFFILALSQNQVRLLEGTKQTVDEIDLEDLPKSISEAFQYDRLNKHLQFHSSTTSPGTGVRPGGFHGHDPNDKEKSMILKWFQKIDKELPKLLFDQQSPLMLAGVEYLFPLYIQANSYPHLIEKGIPGNPDKLTPEELHSQAWPIIEPIILEAQEKAISRYHQMISTGQTTNDVQTALLAAYQGRVSELFVALGVQIWGSCELSENSVEIHKNQKSGDKDLLDLAAIHTLLNGGVVHAFDPEKVPDKSPIAAILRY